MWNCELPHNAAGKLEWDNLQMDKGYSPLLSYGRTKLMIAMASYELARRLAQQGAPVTVNVGTFHTPHGLARHMCQHSLNRTTHTTRHARVQSIRSWPTPASRPTARPCGLSSSKSSKSSSVRTTHNT